MTNTQRVLDTSAIRSDWRADNIISFSRMLKKYHNQTPELLTTNKYKTMTTDSYRQGPATPEPNQAEPYSGYAISIRPASNGFIVTVGCKDFVFEDRERMLQKIGEYYSNPAEVEKKFRDGMLILKS